MSTTPTQVPCDIKNLELADMGKKRIDWANQSMKVLQIIRKEFIKNQPLQGVRISACLHVTAETANLAIALTTSALIHLGNSHANSSSAPRSQPWDCHSNRSAKARARR